MATDIEFSGTKVRLHQHDYKTKTLWTDSNKFLNALRSTFVVDTGLLPPGLRWVSPAKTFWLFESAPKLQTVIFHYGEADEGHEGKELHTFTVMLPWTAMLVEINAEYFPIRTWCFAMPGPIQSEFTKIGLLPLPNHYPCAQICYPKDANLKAGSCHNVGDAIRLAKEFAWYSYANEDITDTFSRTMELKMPAFLFVDDNGDWRGDFEDMTYLLDAWEDTPAERVLSCTTGYTIPSNSITEPEALMGGSPMQTLREALGYACQVEQYNYSHITYFEEAVQAAFSRSM